MAKEKVNYQEVYDLYQLCCKQRHFASFLCDYGVNLRASAWNLQRNQLWSEKLGKTVQVDQTQGCQGAITESLNSPQWKKWNETARSELR